MSNNALEKWRAGAASGDARKIETALARLGQAQPQQRNTGGGIVRHGRLIVVLDLTASREGGLTQARKATAAMFEAITSFGSVAVKLVFFRGRECKAGKWERNAEAVCGSMLALSCRCGHTKIGRVLRLVADEPGPVSGVVYIGDHCEEDGDELAALAGRLGEKHIPVWMFHEIDHADERWKLAKPIFEAMAAESGGAYCPFGAASADTLRELLSTVAAFSAAGAEGINGIEQARTPEARQLRNRLLLPPAPKRLKC